MSDILKISREQEDIIIRISVKDLADLAETHAEYPFKVLDEEKFGNEVVDQLKNYGDSNDREIGSTRCAELFESILEQIAETCDDSVVELIEVE